MRLALLLFVVFGACTAVFSQDKVQPALELIGLAFTPDEVDSLRGAVSDNREGYFQMRAYGLANSTAPALYFNPLPDGFSPIDNGIAPTWKVPEDVEVPADLNDLAFYSVLELASLIKYQKITSVELTQFFIDRFNRFGDDLQCVISLTPERALKMAKKADREIAAGYYRGPLHGIPYGAKDLLAVPGYKTTWGAAPYKDQLLQETATVVQRLDDAGAVLVAKLTLGALAWGDVWYGGVTKTPWNLELGSSGSSAGSASATAAGLVPFSIGTETLGSIVSPSTRCHVSGLRPTFGRVSRAGAMALSWSMDKIGPICRSAADCAVVFDHIRGSDGKDRTLMDADFRYDQDADVTSFRIGYFKNLFDRSSSTQKEDSLALEILRSAGLQLEAVEYDIDLPIGPQRIILNAEAAAAFDELTRSNRDSLLVRQIKRAWPNAFREARLIPAVEYIQANRYRTQLINAFHHLIKDYDVIITPTFGGSQLLTTNLTGHPCMVVPHGFAENRGGKSLSFIGNLFEEDKILLLAEFYQSLTDHDELTPPGF